MSHFEKHDHASLALNNAIQMLLSYLNQTLLHVLLEISMVVKLG